MPGTIRRLSVCALAVLIAASCFAGPRVVLAEGFFSEVTEFARAAFCSFASWVGITECGIEVVNPSGPSASSPSNSIEGEDTGNDTEKAGPSSADESYGENSPVLVVNHTSERIIEPRYIVVNQSGTADVSFSSRLSRLERRVEGLADNKAIYGGGGESSGGVSASAVTDLLSDYLPLSGGTLTGALDLPSFRVTSAATPSSVNYRFGVGTTTPSDTLALDGPFYIAQITAPAVTTDRLYNDGGDLYWNGALIGGGGVGSWSSNGTDVYRASGNVGIGTSSPYAKLSITNTGTGPSFLVADSADPDSSPFVVDASGNAGVGILSPVGKLHVASGMSGQNAPNAAADELVVESAGHVGISLFSPSTHAGFILFCG